MQERNKWSVKARRLIPELEVLGARRDADGWLVRIDLAPTAETLETLEIKMQQLGATGWHWEVDKGRLKMRVYTGQSRRAAKAAKAALIALTALIVAWYHDILHTQSLIRLWSH